MKILQVHNYYQQPGGEDVVVSAERSLLETAGHRVVRYLRRNDEIVLNGLASRARLAVRTVWARDSQRALRDLIARERPDVAHFHNTLPLISPSAYYACRSAGVPVVQTLHNYRLLCPAATLFRNGAICEECVDHNLGRSVRHGCYRHSRFATAAVAGMLVTHHAMQTWSRSVDCYVALSEFARGKFVEAGWPPEKLVVKPNFVHPDPGPRNGAGDYVIFVGRLSEEKGLRTLLAAWRQLGANVPLWIVGDGPLRSELEAENSGQAIRFLGRLPAPQALEAMKESRFLVFPSQWYEGFPMTLVEAFACGVPVIASRHGVMTEIVEDGQTGLHFTPGDVGDLATKLQWACMHPQEMVAMGHNARREFLRKYDAGANYKFLMQLYRNLGGTA